MPRSLSLIRIDESVIGGRVPTDRLMERMGRLIEETKAAGVLLETAGLRSTAEGTRVHWRKGAATVTDGPFTESKEVVGGYAILRTSNKLEAIEWTKRFLGVHEDELELTCEVREIEEG